MQNPKSFYCNKDTKLLTCKFVLQINQFYLAVDIPFAFL